MLNHTVNVLNKSGLTWFVPMVRLAAGEDPREQLREILRKIGIPVLAFAVFLMLWGGLAKSVQTSLGALPGPAAVWNAAGGLFAEHRAEREKAAAFYERQEQRNAETLAQDPNAEARIRPWTGKPTYPDQILTSLLPYSPAFCLRRSWRCRLASSAGCPTPCRPRSIR